MPTSWNVNPDHMHSNAHRSNFIWSLGRVTWHYTQLVSILEGQVYHHPLLEYVTVIFLMTIAPSKSVLCVKRQENASRLYMDVIQVGTQLAIGFLFVQFHACVFTTHIRTFSYYIVSKFAAKKGLNAFSSRKPSTGHNTITFYNIYYCVIIMQCYYVIR